MERKSPSFKTPSCHWTRKTCTSHRQYRGLDETQRDVVKRERERAADALPNDLCLLGFHNLGRRSLQLSAEDTVPESTGDAESIFEVGVVVLQVIFLEFLIVQREADLH